MRGGLTSVVARAVVGAALVAALVWVGMALADSSLPAPSITAKPANPTNQISASFTYTDSQSVSFQCSLDGSSFAACGGPGTSGSKSYPGPLAAGSHQFQVKAVSGSKSSTTSYSWVIDLTAPAVSSMTRVGSSPTNTTGPVQWTVKFSENVTGVDSGDFSPANGGGVSGTSIAPVAGSGSTYTVTVNSGSGSGTLGLNLVDNDSIADSAGNNLGGSGAGNGNFSAPAAQQYTFDRTPPTVQSITRVGASSTAAGSVQWTVVFSESVTGVDTGDFALANTGLTSPSVSAVSGSGATYTVTASTGSGSGTLGLDVVDNDSIKDSVGNPLGGAGSGNGNATGPTYTVDRTPPLVSSINRADASPTNAGSVQWTVMFSKPVTGVDSTDFALVKGGLGGSPAITGVTGSGPGPYTLTASTGTGSGMLGLNLVDNDSIQDGVGNKLGGAGNGNGNFTGQVYSIDRTAPTVVSINRADPSPTNAANVHWTVTFSEPVTGVVPSGSNFSLVASNVTGSPAIAAATGSGASYAVTASTGTSTSGPNGTLQLKATSAGGIVDAAGNALTGLPVTGQSYTIDKKAPDAPTITFAPFAWPPIGWSSTNATFVFDNGSDTVSYQCKLDAGPYAGCISPSGYSSLVQGQHVFTVKATDTAGNQGPGSSWTFFVDTVPPTNPAFSQTPPDPAPSSSATFAWSSGDPGAPGTGTGVAGYLCSKENGSYFGCSSPYSYTVQATNNGQHQFSVVAVDRAGNVSDVATYKWKVQSSTGLPFTIGVQSPTGLLYPGGPDAKLNLVFTNPNSSPITINSLDITVTGTNAAPCPLALAAVTVSQPFTGPVGPIPGGSVPTSLADLGVPQSSWPRLHMADTGTNQNGCRGIQVTISFTNGQATG